MAALLPFALAVIHPLHALVVEVSTRFQTLAGRTLAYALIPLTLLAGYGADALVRRSRAGQYSGRVLFTAACIAGGVLIGIVAGQEPGSPWTGPTSRWRCW